MMGMQDRPAQGTAPLSTPIADEYDVIIVGGRPAGATLAARLGKRGQRVLIIDRADFPSLPGVPSSPVLHPGAMRILDELGIAEASYCQRDARMHTMAFEYSNHFSAIMGVPEIWGRNYVCG